MQRKRELLAKVIANREHRALMAGKVRPADPKVPLNPKTRYIWANRNPERIVQFKIQGYEVCKDPKVATDWQKEDGTHIYGDLILMEIDQDLWEANKLYSQMKAIEGVEGEEVFKAFAERAGIPVQITA
jgi:ribosomal protein S30